MIHYHATVTQVRFLRTVELQLVATPVAQRQPYRVCVAHRCVGGMLTGFGNAAATGTITVSTAGLPATATFTWWVDGKVVASKRVRLR